MLLITILKKIKNGWKKCLAGTRAEVVLLWLHPLAVLACAHKCTLTSDSIRNHGDLKTTESAESANVSMRGE